MADPFPWAEVEAFAAAIVNDPDLAARFVPANRPPAERNPFDYEVMRSQLTVMIESINSELLQPRADAEGLGVTPLGRVAAPPEHESTSGVFYFWVDRKQSVERTQIVTTSCNVADRVVKFVGIVQEVYRRSQQKNISEESARFDGRSSERPPFDSEGVTYAEVAILRTEPVLRGLRPSNFNRTRSCCINRVFVSRCWQKSPFLPSL